MFHFLNISRAGLLLDENNLLKILIFIFFG